MNDAYHTQLLWLRIVEKRAALRIQAAWWKYTLNKLDKSAKSTSNSSNNSRRKPSFSNNIENSVDTDTDIKYSKIMNKIGTQPRFKLERKWKCKSEKYKNWERKHFKKLDKVKKF